MTLYTQKRNNIFKTWLLVSGFWILIILLGWLFAYQTGEPSFVILAVAINIIMTFVSYWQSDKIVLFMNNAREIDEKNPNEKVIDRLVENLAITAGLPKPKTYIIEDSAMNAFATGRNEKHAVVALTTGLISKLEKVELEGVIAHELSHVKNKDIQLQTMIVVMVGFVALISDFFLRFSIFGGGKKRDKNESGGLGAILTIVSIVFALLAPLIAQLIKLAVSRKREYLADASGALLTRYPDGLARALEKISNDPNELNKAKEAMAHIYISNPFKGKNFSELWMTHPPIEKRITALRHLKNENLENKNGEEA